jgi:hypothetical protein
MLALDLSLAEIVPALTARGVRSLVLKGPVLARWLYDEPGERGYDDVDLLVDPRARSAAEDVLRERGFTTVAADLRPGERDVHADPWRRANPAALVDLHRTVALLDAPAQRVWDALAAGAEPLDVAGVTVQMPGPAARSLVVALHAAQHGPGRTRPHADLERALARVDEATWRETLALARALDGEAALLAGLGTTEAGAELARRLALDARIPARIRLQRDGAGPTALGFERLAHAGSARARGRLVAGKLVPTPAFLRAWEPRLTRRRGGLLLAYLWRPLWLAGHAPSGWAAWRAARADQDER